MKCVVNLEAYIYFVWLLVLHARGGCFYPSWYLCHLEMELLSNTPTFNWMFMHVECFTLLKASLILSTNGRQSETLERRRTLF